MFWGIEMGKKTAILFLVLFAMLGSIFLLKHQKKQPEENAIRDMQERIEQALGAEYEKQKETVIAAVLRYRYKDGDEINYYILKTTFFAADPAEVDGYHADAVYILIDPNNVANSTEMMIQDWPAMHYETDRLSYLCWTYSPEVSYALEYDPDCVSREDIIKMAESVGPIQ